MTEISVLIQHHAGPTGKVLVCRNAEGKWEFPCGAARTNESGEEAVRRIAWETLGMTVKAGKLTMRGHKNPKDGKTEHIACGNITHNTNTKCNYHEYYEAVDIWQTEPEARKYTEYQWVHPTRLAQLEFDGDDVNFMAKYGPWVSGGEIPDVRMP